MTAMDANTLVQSATELRQAVVRHVACAVVGQHHVVEHLLLGLAAQGHVLLVGAPGLAKTLLVKTLAQALSLQFGRVQCTPDLMPADITGTDVLEGGAGKERRFRFVEGPVFCNILLADEINRTPPKTQAALLEAMAERAVTVGGVTRPLPAPFLVFATQNPIEHAGTYPLPEAQLDRFLFHVDVPYPTEEEEMAIARGDAPSAPPAPIPAARLRAVIDAVPHVPCADHVVTAAVRLVRATRPPSPVAEVTEHVRWGAGPRAAQMLITAAKARALLDGRFAVDIADVRAMAAPVLRHRLVLQFEALSAGVSTDDVIARVVAAVAR